MKTCHQCGGEWADKRSPGFREECPGCGAPLHCCANCRFHEPGAARGCREPQARDERPRDAESGNLCPYFVFDDRGDDDAAARERKAREGLAALFGDAPESGRDQPHENPEWMRFDRDDPADPFRPES